MVISESQSPTITSTSSLARDAIARTLSEKPPEAPPTRTGRRTEGAMMCLIGALKDERYEEGFSTPFPRHRPQCYIHVVSVAAPPEPTIGVTNDLRGGLLSSVATYHFCVESWRQLVPHTFTKGRPAAPSCVESSPGWSEQSYRAYPMAMWSIEREGPQGHFIAELRISLQASGCNYVPFQGCKVLLVGWTWLIFFTLLG